MRTDLLKSTQDKGDNIKSVFQMQYICTIPYHAYLIHTLPCHLFINVKNEKGQLVSDVIWMNSNKTLNSLNLKRGDIVVLEAYAEMYKLGNEYHPNNVYRGKHKVFRLLYPSNAMVIGQELVPQSSILDLVTLKVYTSYDDYVQGAKIHSKENYYYTFIHLIDNTQLENIFNRRGNIINPQYPIRCIFLDCWLALTPEQRVKILDNRKYTYTQILEYQQLIKEL